MKSVLIDVWLCQFHPRHDKVKVQCFLSGIQVYYRDRITYDEPKTLRMCSKDHVSI